MATLNPYLTFNGNAREAMTFYHEVLGGDLAINTFGEYGMADSPQADQIMHARVATPTGMNIMASDTAPGMDVQPIGGFAISLSGEDEAELRGYWDKLVEGGTVMMPLEPQMWGDTYGQVTDRFGVSWMIDIVSAEAAPE